MVDDRDESERNERGEPLPPGADRDRSAGLLGDPTAPLGVLFVCVNRDYSVVFEVLTDEPPLCPNDGSVLERYQG